MTENPKSKPAFTIGTDSAGRPCIFGPDFAWSLDFQGEIDNVSAKVVCEQIVEALFGEETPEERFWRTRAAAEHEQHEREKAEHARRVDELLEANNRYLEKGRAARLRVAELEADIAKLKDPVAVHINMLVGKIAKPDIRTMLHAYGAEALGRWDRAERLEGHLADLSYERDCLLQERDAALAVNDMVNRSANAWARGCDRAERTIRRLKARIGRLKAKLPRPAAAETPADEQPSTVTFPWKKDAA